MIKWIITLVIISTSAFAQKTKEIVAIVGSKKITVEEFEKKYKEMTSQIVVNAPTKKVFLEDLIRYEIGVQEAKKRNFDKDPIVLEKLNQEMYKALLEKELGQKVQENTVSEAEMKSYYNSSPEVRISTIVIEVKPGATQEQRAEAKKRAEEILSEVKSAKRPFEELVRLYSDDIGTKNLGGDIGWQTKTSLVPSFYKAAIDLKINEITPKVVETTFGYHIFKLTGKKTYEEASKREIRMAVFDEKRKIVFNQFFEKLKKNYKIDVNTKIIE